MIFKKSLALYKLKNIAEKGLKPSYKLIFQSDEFYGEGVIGYGRHYAALGVDESVDMIARIWRNDQVRKNDYAVLENGEQFRITFIQQKTDEDGLEVTDLTLERLEKNYDIANKA